VGQAATSDSQASASNDSNIKGAFPITLSRPLDSKKLKDGDVVMCQTIGVLRSRSGLIVPSGSKVIGHITQAKARSKGDSESSLAMEFDKIQLTGGKELSMTGVVQAVGPSLGTHSGPNTGAASPGTLPGRGDASTMPPATSGAVAGPDSGIHPLSSG